jgi:hypothetical protein
MKLDLVWMFLLLLVIADEHLTFGLFGANDV